MNMPIDECHFCHCVLIIFDLNENMSRFLITFILDILIEIQRSSFLDIHMNDIPLQKNNKKEKRLLKTIIF